MSAPLVADTSTGSPGRGASGAIVLSCRNCHPSAVKRAVTSDAGRSPGAVAISSPNEEDPRSRMSALHGARGQTRYEPPLSDQEHECNRDGGDNGARGKVVPVLPKLAVDELPQPHGQRVYI